MKKVGLENIQNTQTNMEQLLHEQAQSILQEEFIDHQHKLCGCNWRKQKAGATLEVKDICYTQMWITGIISDKDVVENS